MQCSSILNLHSSWINYQDLFLLHSLLKIILRQEKGWRYEVKEVIIYIITRPLPPSFQSSQKCKSTDFRVFQRKGKIISRKFRIFREKKISRPFCFIFAFCLLAKDEIIFAFFAKKIMWNKRIFTNNCKISAKKLRKFIKKD